MNNWREHFNMPDGSYLLTHSAGCQPIKVAGAIDDAYLQPWRNLGGDAWPKWMDAIERFNQNLAALLNGQADEFCPQVNLSSGLSKFIGSMPRRPERDVIVLSELDFPSIGFVAQQAERDGYRLRYINSDKSLTDPGVWAEQLDENVQLVMVTHALSNDSRCLPVAEITREARSRGIYSAVDIAQSVGVIPINLTQWTADFVYGSCLKWLCGGPGAGFCWISNDTIKQFEPKDVGWFSHVEPFEFDIHHFNYASSAQRFMGGTPSIAPFACATVGLELLIKIGVQTVAAHNNALLTQLWREIPSQVIVSPDANSPRGGTVVIKVPMREKFIAALTDAKIWCDERNTGFRFSPHIYSNAEDIEQLTRCVHAAL